MHMPGNQEPHAPSLVRLRFRGKGVREAPHVVLYLAVAGEELHVRAVDLDLAFLAQLDVVVAPQRREAPVLADDDLLPAGELVLRAAQGLDGGGAVCPVSLHLNHFEDENVRASRVRTLRMIWPMLTRATLPFGLPKAP